MRVGLGWGQGGVASLTCRSYTDTCPQPLLPAWVRVSLHSGKPMCGKELQRSCCVCRVGLCRVGRIT